MQLSTYMAEHKLDDAAFAALVGNGCSEWTVRKWRYGQRVPRPEMQARIHDTTKGAVTVADLVAAWRDERARQGAAA